MSDDAVLNRLGRIYAALDATIEVDLSKFPPTVVSGNGLFGIYQDFLGDLNPEQLENLAHSVIHNIANFRGHLRRWLREHSEDMGIVSVVLDASPSFQLICDLSNNDKHGYPPRDGGHSGKAPKLTEIGRVMKLTTGATAGSSVMMTLSTRGPVITATGGGSATVVVTGSIVDQDGSPLGDLYQREVEALEACEQTLDGLVPVKAN